MKTFKEFRGESPITQIDEQVYFKIRIPDMSPMFMKASSESAVKLDMRQKLKPDVVKEITIKRVTKAEMRKIYRAMGQGKEDEPEPTEEGFFDRFTKKGKEKRAKEKGEKQARDAKSEKEKAEIKRMDNLGMKGAGQHTLSPDEKSELSRLRSKYSDLVKRRAEKARSRGPR
jgi:hypothetical protein